MKVRFALRSLLQSHMIFYFLSVLFCVRILYAQETQNKSSQKPLDKPIAEAPKTPAQIELLETRIRFEADGSSRKDVHARVRINSELGARQFGRLNFDYHRTFEQIEIPLVRLTHSSGGTADILPKAISDQPNPAVVDAPAYHDVRRKTVRILGMAPGDTLEYRVITTLLHAPLAPDFHLSHSFSQGGVVTDEFFELDFPASRQIQLYINPAAPATTVEKSGQGDSARNVYRWRRNASAANSSPSHDSESADSDVVLTTFASWQQLVTRLAKFFTPDNPGALEIAAKVSALMRDAAPNADAKPDPDAKIEAIYNFVSQKIRTVDLPPGATGFRTRPAIEILTSGYATPEDKFVLFSALLNSVVVPRAGFVASPTKESSAFARPSVFDHLVTEVRTPSVSRFVDLNIQVAPYGMIPSQFRGRRVLMVDPDAQGVWRAVPQGLPFPAKQQVRIGAMLAADGKLTAKVHYVLRGDNELLLRVAFFQTPQEKWKNLAQLLAISDGFRGEAGNVSASDPSSTKQPFTLDYEITVPKFVDWSKRPVRIPALLPQVGLPDPPTKSATVNTPSSIDLGTPLEVETYATLEIPAGTTARAPTGTSVERDYATFTSKYGVLEGAPPSRNLTLTATRRIRFLLREVPAERAADYNAFVRAIQNDEAQDFTLERSDTPAAPTAPKKATATEKRTPNPN
ncbi:MAG TPA: DUF3857 domain-containing protein [Candidatus Dormibacteraeota bacterium]|nr:DUF3857 domain-containing protein [Candidatus Dormibacteraeota bacterium]